MPGFVINLSTTVLCVHGGQAKPTLPNPRVRVMGLPTVVQPPPWIIAGCTNVPPPPGRIPCLTAQWVTGAVRVTSMGMPLLLVDSTAICIPNGTPVSVIPSQFRVKAL